MVKKKSPVVLLTIVGVAIAGAVVMNARQHQPDVPQQPDGPVSTPQTGQAAPLETKADVFGAKPDATKTKPAAQAKPPTPPPSLAPVVPKPGPNDAAGQWYR